MPDPLATFSDWLMWAVGGLLTFVGLPTGKVITDNRARSKANKRTLEGDPNDPNNEGINEIVADTRQRVGVLEEKLDTARRERKHEHEAVMGRIDDLDGRE